MTNRAFEYAFVVAAALAMTVAGCAKDNSASDGAAYLDRPSDPTIADSQANNGTTGASANASAASPTRTASVPETPKYPKNAEFTIRCASIAGPGHVERAIQLKGTISRDTASKLKDWHLLHENEESTLFYGYYGSSKKENSRAKLDIQKLYEVTDSRGNHPFFPTAVIVPLATPDPVAPADWNLANAPAGMNYTLEIGVYKDSPQRKQYAVDAVREARAQGVNAFFYHGESASSVCVGVWPDAAVRVTGGDVGGADERMDPDKPIIVLPAGRQSGWVRTQDGSVVKPVTPTMTIVDPSLKQAMQEFPNHEVNGEATGVKNKKTGDVVAEKSVVMKIPRSEPSRFGLGIP